MAYFNIKKQVPGTIPIPEYPGYVPPVPPTPPSPEPGSVPDIPRPTYSGDLTCTFYNVSDDADHLTKRLGTGYPLDIHVEASIDILNPFVIINDPDIHMYNYCYIAELGRYYYVVPSAMPGGLTRLDMSVDALMSWKEGIKKCNAIVVKTEASSVANDDLNDGTYLTQEGEFIDVLVYSNGFDDTASNILIVAG